DGLDFLSACAALGASPADFRAGPAHKAQVAYGPPEPEQPPGAAWQARATAYISEAEAALWSPRGARALAYLRNERGLTHATVAGWQLGYQSRTTYEQAEQWGAEQDVWLPRGI